LPAFMKNIVLWLVIAMVLMSVFNSFAPKGMGAGAKPIDYTSFLEQVDSSNVERVEITNNEIQGLFKDGQRFNTTSPGDPDLVNQLYKQGVRITAKKEEGQSLLMQIFLNFFPFLLLIGVWIYFMKQMQGGGGRGAMSFGKSKAQLLSEDKNNVTFDDVAGVDEAKEDVEELVQFLRDPSKFHKLGGKMPRGILLTGSPGTGKTLLAKAIAGEAKVPFFTISGSDFVEMFVGVGASRVRDMFAQAKKSAPCIIFIDEIDAVGRKRGSGMGGGHDEREQTLNQLLVEMDGFEEAEGVIVIAATNRPDVLDPALLRPGRFDRQVVVPLPDIKGREEILIVHMGKVPLADDIDTKVIARGSPGFSGAELANLINEATLFAAKENLKKVSMRHFELARDKLIMGAERRSSAMTEEEKRNTAFHESGHAVVAKVLEKFSDPVHKLTIIPRGRTLGFLMRLPERDVYSHSREKLLADIAISLGGRIAEEIFMDQMTTGASSDFEHATNTAQNMVCRWGMSDALGTRIYTDPANSFMGGGDAESRPDLSPAVKEKVDAEISKIIDEQYTRARKIVEDNRDKLEAMTVALLEWETLDATQINDIMEGKAPKPPEDKPKKKGPKGGTSAKKKAAKKKRSSSDEADLPDPTEAT
jgi:cell division protease FtsH